MLSRVSRMEAVIVQVASWARCGDLYGQGRITGRFLCVIESTFESLDARYYALGKVPAPDLARSCQAVLQIGVWV